MRRGLVVGFIAAVVISLLLAIAVASIGTQFDEVRLERDDLEFEVEDLRTGAETLRREQETLRAERDSLRAERDTIKTQVDEQLKMIEQLKVELDRARPPVQTD